MHEGGSRDGSAPIPPAAASDRPGLSAETRRPGPFRALLTYLLVAALSAVAGVGAALTVQRVTARAPGSVGTPRHAAADRLNSATVLNDEAVYHTVEPGVVDVSADLDYLRETAKGTGFVIDAAAGLILTNNHVIDGAASVTVTPVSSGRSYPARVLGYDHADDLALLQVRGVPRLAAVRIGSSARAGVGTAVLAIGLVCARRRRRR